MDLQSEYVNLFLQDVAFRVMLTAEAISWVDGDQVLMYDELLPKMSEGSRAWHDFQRFSKQVQSMFPRAMSMRRQGAVGTVTWTETAPEVGKVLDALRLRRIAKEASKQLLTNGIAALWPVLREEPRADGEDDLRLQVLRGHLEVLWDEDDVGGKPAALMQVTGNFGTNLGAGIRYDIHLWSFYDGTLRIWRNAPQPFALGGTPSETYGLDGETIALPTVAWIDTTQDGYPVGEFKTYLPTAKQQISQALRIMRTSQLHAYPNWAMAGQWEAMDEVGPSTVFRAVDPTAKVTRLEAGDMSQLFTEADRIEDEMRTNLMLPITRSGEIPSGEALMQANASYNAASDDYAEVLGELLTGGARGYLELNRTPVEDLKVTVKPNRELRRLQISMQVREDFKEGIINREMALLELEQFYPTMSSEMIEKWLEEADTVLEPAATSLGADAVASLDTNPAAAAARTERTGSP